MTAQRVRVDSDGDLARTSREPERRYDAFVRDGPDETAVKAAKAFSERREIIGGERIDRTGTCTERIVSERPQPPLSRRVCLAANERSVCRGSHTDGRILLRAILC